MLGDGEAVGHSGDEVADAADLFDFAFAAPFGRKQRRVRPISGGEAADDAQRLAADGDQRLWLRLGRRQ